MKIPLFKTYSDSNDIKVVTDIIKRGTFWAEGKEIKEFEKKVAKYIGRRYALAFNSGTSALHILLLAYGIKEKEIIVPSFTFIATANAVTLAGGKPVFAETESDTGGLDANDVEGTITSKTKAIINVHYAGFPSRDIKKLRNIAKKNKITLIEDAAEAFGAQLGKKKVGTFGDSAMFSLCQSKIISTGEGGLIVTDSKRIYNKARSLRSHGQEPGYNLRMPTMLAALGISQLEKVNLLIEKRRKIAKHFTKELSKIKEIGFLKESNYVVYQLYPILLKNKKIRDSLQKYLKKKGIESKVYFKSIKPYVGKEMSERVLCLPIYPSMSNKEKDYIIKMIKEFKWN